LPARENQVNDLPIAAIALGLYDWTIALDHHRDHAYLISQGFERGIVEGSVQSVTNAVSAKHASAPLANTTQARLRRARQRAETVVRWLSESVVHHPGNPAPRPFRLSGQHPTAIDERLQSNFTSPAYRDAIDTVVGSIHQGETFQVNLAQRLVCDAHIPSQDLYLRLRQTNPAPMAGYLNVGPFAVVSSSPEGFLTVRDRIVETRPIKGTVPRVGDAEIDAAAARDLQSNEKERAENIMIVDLMRNDLSRVCDDQTLKVTQLCQVQQFRHVQHLVSVITGRLQEDCNITDLIAACFPGGSITGAPKIAAMQRISTQETHPRGAYCGSMGYISCGGAADLNILIRTITAAHGWWQIPVGGGITAASTPQA
ncbi:MAG: anthranilate synthase component I family protein, partial [Planctomycetota bacterium]